jgi:hypothetical protein
VIVCLIDRQHFRASARAENTVFKRATNKYLEIFPFLAFRALEIVSRSSDRRPTRRPISSILPSRVFSSQILFCYPRQFARFQVVANSRTMFRRTPITLLRYRIRVHLCAQICALQTTLRIRIAANSKIGSTKSE